MPHIITAVFMLCVGPVGPGCETHEVYPVKPWVNYAACHKWLRAKAFEVKGDGLTMYLSSCGLRNKKRS